MYKCTLRHIFILKVFWNHGNGSKDKKIIEKYQVSQEPLANQKMFMIESIFTFNLFLLGFVRYVTEYTYTYSIMVNIAFKFESNTIFREFLSSELTYVPSIPCK